MRIDGAERQMTKPESRLVRQWLMIRALSMRRDGVTIHQLSREADVSPKTVRRDLQVLAKAGFPLREHSGPHGVKFWKIDSQSHFGTNFTLDEALALYIALRLMDPLAGTYLWQAARRAVQKIRVLLSPLALQYVDRMAAVLHHTSAGQSDYEQKAELIDQLMIGIEDQQVIHIHYRSATRDAPISYEIHPYGIVMHRKALYLVAYSTVHREVRHFKVDRIEAVQVTKTKFQPQEDFNLQKHLEDSFGIFKSQGRPARVRIRFSPQAARYVAEAQWHSSQRISHCADGSLILELRLADTTELKSWVLSFGAHAEVLAPLSFRTAVRDELQAMVKRYGPGVVSARVGHRGADRAQHTAQVE